MIVSINKTVLSGYVNPPNSWTPLWLESLAERTRSRRRIGGIGRRSHCIEFRRSCPETTLPAAMVYRIGAGRERSRSIQRKSRERRPHRRRICLHNKVSSYIAALDIKLSLSKTSEPPKFSSAKAKVITREPKTALSGVGVPLILVTLVNQCGKGNPESLANDQACLDVVAMLPGRKCQSIAVNLCCSGPTHSDRCKSSRL